MALVGGTSDSASLDAMAQSVKMANFVLHASPYYDFVESAADWSDEISREGMREDWPVELRFYLVFCRLVLPLIQLPCTELG